MTRLKQDDSLSMAANFGKIVSGVDTPAPNRAIFRFAQKYILAPQRLASDGFVIPRKYYESVGSAAFLRKPIGAGPYKLIDYARNSRIVLEAHDGYWRGAPKIKRVTILVVSDTSARIAAIQAGQVDFAHNLPVREVLRLGALPGLVGDLHPISNVVMIHMVNKGVFKDRDLRLSMHHAIDKAALSKAFFNGKAEALSTWAGRGAPSYDPDFKFPYDAELAKRLLATSGYTMSNPAKIDFFTFNGVFPNDFDIARSLVQMWKQVGIETNLQTIEFAKYGELSRNDRLEAPVLYNWFNPTDDPESYSGSILNPAKRFSVWKSDDILPRLDPLLGETNYDKRISGYKEFDRWTVEQGYAFPILQGVATVVHTKHLDYVPYRSGLVAPNTWTLSS
jgi:peptide/nickel transport system substrate-binding protein